MANKDNPAKGAKFELLIQSYFKLQGVELVRPFTIKIGTCDIKKDHKFDLGSEVEKIIIECKAHSWTEGGNAPSAKMSVWNEAMYYFHLAPDNYRKLFFFKKNSKNNLTLGEYYIKRYEHLIPEEVEFWEYCTETNQAQCIYNSM